MNEITEVEQCPTNTQEDKTATVAPIAPPQLAYETDILAKYAEELRSCGVAGNLEPYKLCLLAAYTRHGDKPVNIIFKGSPGAGKSNIVEMAMKYLPSTAFIEMNAMSPKAINHSSESFEHKHIFLGEWAGLQSEEGNASLRQLISQGRLVYQVVEKQTDGPQKTVTKKLNGPTGLITCTTEKLIHSDEESRLISVYIEPTESELADIYKAIADRCRPGHFTKPNIEPWHELENYISNQSVDVYPICARAFTHCLRNHGIPPDYGRTIEQIMHLVAAHGRMHMLNRRRSEEQYIIAGIQDYAAVYEMLHRHLQRRLHDTIQPDERTFVKGVVSVTESRNEYALGVPQNVIAEKFGWPAYRVSRMFKDAEGKNLLRNERQAGGKTDLWIADQSMPGKFVAMPTPEEIETEMRRCGEL